MTLTPTPRLHPRAKQTIGRRLALAASAVAYGHADVPFTGPKLKNCSVLGEIALDIEVILTPPCTFN
jgi:hypothetical protein